MSCQSHLDRSDSIFEVACVSEFIITIWRERRLTMLRGSRDTSYAQTDKQNEQMITRTPLHFVQNYFQKLKIFKYLYFL